MRNLAVLALLCIAVTVTAQQSVRLDMERAFQLATDSSITADRYRSVFQEAHYAWLSWMAGRKPQIDLSTTPLQFEQDMTQRYVSDTDNDEYREQKRLLSSVSLEAQQVMERWGGSFYASTGLAYLGNYGDYIQHQFATTPIRVGYRQELLGYNPYRWNRQTEPMRLNVAQQQMNYSVEQTGAEAVRRFFTLAVAQEQLSMAQEQLQSCDSILAIGERRFRIASISKAELEILTLQRSLATTALKNALLNHQKAAKSLAVWLGMDELTHLELIVPSILPQLSVTVGDAVSQATQHNPNYLSMELQELEARRDADQLKRKKGLNASIDASIGLNQVSERFEYAYRNPLVQNQVMVNLTVPISDTDGSGGQSATGGGRRHPSLAADSRRCLHRHAATIHPRPGHRKRPVAGTTILAGSAARSDHSPAGFLEQLLPPAPTDALRLPQGGAHTSLTCQLLSVSSMVMTSSRCGRNSTIRCLTMTKICCP